MSKYLKAFQALKETASELYELVGDCCLIEELKDDEFRTKTGLYIASGNERQINGLAADKPTFARILLVGQGSPNEDGDIVPYDLNPGDIVLVGSTSIKRFSVFGKLVSYGETTLGLINAETVQMRFKGQEGFNRTFELLNRAVEAEVARGQNEG